MIGNIISAGAGIIGGMLNSKATKENNAAQLAHAQAQMDQQERFAKQGIRWKVNDARKAGIHPLYALGANTVSYSPVSVGSTPDTSMGNAIASAGQDLSRAATATATHPQRANAFSEAAAALSLERGQLENNLIRAQIAKLSAQIPPAMPSLDPVVADQHKEAPKWEDQDKISTGFRWFQHPKWSPANLITDAWGEPAEYAYAIPKIANDLYWTLMGRHVKRATAGGSGW